MPEAVHKILTNMWRIYLCVGGMPQVIIDYLNSEKNLLKMSELIPNTIITAYLSDMSKYTVYKSESIKISSIYEKMPAQLAKENKKFVFYIQHGTLTTDYHFVEIPYQFRTDRLYADVITNFLHKGASNK